jgi:hypothetical protein
MLLQRYRGLRLLLHPSPALTVCTDPRVTVPPVYLSGNRFHTSDAFYAFRLLIPLSLLYGRPYAWYHMHAWRMRWTAVVNNQERCPMWEPRGALTSGMRLAAGPCSIPRFRCVNIRPIIAPRFDPSFPPRHPFDTKVRPTKYGHHYSLS